MLGFGYLEIALLVLLLVLLFGAARAGAILRRIFGVYRQVDQTRREVRSTFSLSSLLRREDDRK